MILGPERVTTVVMPPQPKPLESREDVRNPNVPTLPPLSPDKPEVTDVPIPPDVADVQGLMTPPGGEVLGPSRPDTIFGKRPVGDVVYVIDASGSLTDTLPIVGPRAAPLGAVAPT